MADRKSPPKPKLLMMLADRLFQGRAAQFADPEVVTTFSRGLVNLENELVFSAENLPAGAVVPAVIPFTISIENGAASFSVSGMNWPTAPYAVLPVVLAPADGLAIAVAGVNSLSTDGFAGNLTGATDSDQYFITGAAFFLSGL